MRRSKLKHPLAVLRETLGIPQKAMAAICECNESFVKRIEGGDPKLPLDMARRIVAHTGVNFRWLVHGQPTDPILDVFGLPYRKEFYLELCDDYSGERRVSRHDPTLIKYAAYVTVGRFLLLILAAVERRRTISLVTQLHAFLDELDCEQGFRLSPRLAKELSQAILHDTLREKPNPVRFVTTQEPIPELGLPGGTNFNATAYEAAESRFNSELELVAVLKRFGGEVDSLIAEQRQNPKLVRDDAVDRLPLLMASTGMLLPLASTKLKGAPRRDYQRIAKDALAQEEVIRMVEKLRAAGVATAKLIEQLKRAKVPPAIVECFERLKNLKTRKITISKSRRKPSPATAVHLKSAALAEAKRKSDWSELEIRIDNLNMNSRDECQVCLKRIRELGLEEKLRRVLAEPAP